MFYNIKMCANLSQADTLNKYINRKENYQGDIKEPLPEVGALPP